ncbi:MAG TPA: hypothetical protein VFU07_00765 [Candidatus Lumbricidophila sp.]|nr:hypothetical protein [Candidatus Lumbricidophila sp.]
MIALATNGSLHEPLEARFELGANAAATLHAGDAVIVVGDERSISWNKDDVTQYGRIIEATHIGPDLKWATATVTRNPKKDSEYTGGPVAY